jgi:hypothetical protein
MVIQLPQLLLVMKSKEAQSRKTNHREHKVRLEDSKGETLGNLGNDIIFFLQSSNVPFKLEVKLDILIFDGKLMLNF